MTTLQESYERLCFLRDTVIPWMEKHPENVNLNEFCSDCGTYRCLIGWYKDFTHTDVKQHPQDIFRISSDDHVALFGYVSGCLETGLPTLAARKAYLNKLIAEREKELGIKSIENKPSGAEICLSIIKNSPPQLEHLDV